MWKQCPLTLALDHLDSNLFVDDPKDLPTRFLVKRVLEGLQTIRQAYDLADIAVLVFRIASAFVSFAQLSPQNQNRGK